MTDLWVAQMDSALRNIPGFAELVYKRFLEDRPGEAGMWTQMWLNCEGDKPSPHPVWRQTHTAKCRGLVLMLREKHGDPNEPKTFWSAPLIGDRFSTMEGLTPAMAEQIGRIHREYAEYDLAQAGGPQDPQDFAVE